MYLVVSGGGEGGAAVAARGLVFRRDRQIREVDSEGKSHRGAEVVAGEGDRLVGEVVESDPGHGAWGRGREECRRREAVAGVDVLLVEGVVGARVREVGEGFLVFWVYFLCEEKLTTNGVEPRVDHVWNHVWKHEGIPSVFTSVGLFGLFRSSTARGASRVLAMIVFSARVDARVCL